MIEREIRRFRVKRDMKGGYEYNPKEFGENYEAANLNDSTLSFPLLVRLNLLFACLECIPGLKKSTS